MDFKLDRTTIFIFSVLTASILLLSALNAFTALIFTIIFILLVIYFLNKYIIISLFVMLIPMGEIISSEFNLMGVIGIEELVQIFAFFIVFSIPVSKGRKKGYIKILRSMIFFSLVYILYVWLKDSAFGIESQGLFSFVKMYFKICLKFVILLRILSLIYDKKLINYVNMGIFFGILFLALSSIFTWQLHAIGLNVETSETGVMEDFASNIRAKGLFTGGDVNTFAGFIVIYVGYILTMIERKDFSRKYYIVLAISLMAILIAASRTALGALAVIAFLYFVRNIRQNRSFALIVIFLLVILLFFDQFIMFMSRFDDFAISTHTNVENQGTRIWKWNIYLQYMFANPKSFIFGNPTIINFYRAAHNYFVNILYRGGLVFLLITLYLHIRLISYAFRNRKSMNAFYTIIPYIITIFMVNSSGANQYLLFMLPIMESQLTTSDE